MKMTEVERLTLFPFSGELYLSKGSSIICYYVDYYPNLVENKFIALY